MQHFKTTGSPSPKTKTSFRGSWTPAEIFLALEEGKINAPKFAVLCIVESLTRTRGIGCFASYRKLGEKIGVLERQARNIVGDLLEDGFLVKRQSDTGKDVLVTCWHNHKQTVEYLRSLPYREYLKTDHWKKIRKKALKYAEYRCQLCNVKNVELHVHHRTYDNVGCEKPADLTVLCKLHHEQFHGIKEGGAE